MNWIKNLNIRTKLLSTFIIISIITTLVGYLGINDIGKINDRDSKLYTNMTVPISYLQSISTSFQQIQVNTRNIIAANTTAEILGYADSIHSLQKNLELNADKFSSLMQSNEIKNVYTNFINAFNNYKPLLEKEIATAKLNNDEEATVMLDGRMRELVYDVQNSINKLVAIKLQHAKLFADENSDIASSATTIMIIFIAFGFLFSITMGIYISRYLSQGISNISNRMHSLQNICIANLSKGSEELANGNVNIHIETGTLPLEVKSKDEIGILSQNINNIISQTQATVASVEKAVGAIKDTVEESKLLVDAALTGKLSVRGNSDKFRGSYRELVDGINKTFDVMIQPINESADVLEQMASGELTIKMNGEYKGDFQKIKDSINKLSDSFNNALTEVSEAVSATASAANQISSSSEEMAAGAQEQSSQTAEVASAVEQMSKTIVESTHNTGLVAEKSKQATDNAKNGVKKVSETKAGMDQIVHSTLRTGEVISTLAQKTGQIGEITQVIDDIADQTNLLALNAAIEAARAGEQGRGFAVVADEVRKLAERTTKATKEIAETIKAIQNGVNEAHSSMEESKVSVQNGMKLTDEVSSALNEIMNDTITVSDLANQVSAASEEQTSAAEQISRSIEGISNVTQQGAAGTQQIARAAEDLNRLTINLQELVSKFKLNNHNVSGNQERIKNRNSRKMVA